MAITAAVAATVGTVGTVVSAEKERSARKEANKTSTASQQIEDRNSKRQLARERRIQQAQISSAADAQGSEDSSNVIGATSTLGVQGGVNLSNISRQSNTAQDLSRLNQDIANARTAGQISGVVANAGATAFSATGGFDSLFSGQSGKG